MGVVGCAEIMEYTVGMVYVPIDRLPVPVWVCCERVDVGVDGLDLL